MVHSVVAGDKTAQLRLIKWTSVSAWWWVTPAHQELPNVPHHSLRIMLHEFTLPGASTPHWVAPRWLVDALTRTRPLPEGGRGLVTRAYTQRLVAHFISRLN